MKKSVFLLALLSIVLLSSCNSNDEPVSKQTLYSIMNSRLIYTDNGTIVFSQSNGQIELDNINMTIKFSSVYMDSLGQAQTVASPELRLVPIKENAYYMVDGSDSHPGIIDFGTGMLWYHEIDTDGGTALFMTTQLLHYAYTNTTINDPENGTSDHQESAYMFKLDSRGESCDMSISDFVTNLNGVVDAPALQYKGLTATPTPTGFMITAETANAESGQDYSLTDVEINIYEQCLSFEGSFKCNGLEYHVAGSLFPTN
jgi:hypothetical protein